MHGAQEFYIHAWSRGSKMSVPVRIMHHVHHTGDVHHHNHQHNLPEVDFATTEVGLETLLKGHEGNFQTSFEVEVKLFQNNYFM